MDACSDTELGMPLVLQEYNIEKVHPDKRKDLMLKVRCHSSQHRCERFLWE